MPKPSAEKELLRRDSATNARDACASQSARNRSGYYSTFIAMCLLDIAQTAVHGELFQPMWYVPFVGQYALLAAVGLIAHRRGYDRFFAWYQLVTLLVWALLIRRLLVGNAMTP